MISNDYVGLAISGGGIRSATFHLGLLQTLARAHLISQIDLMSTVSGGGLYRSVPWTTVHSCCAQSSEHR